MLKKRRGRLVWLDPDVMCRFRVLFVLAWAWEVILFYDSRLRPVKLGLNRKEEMNISRWMDTSVIMYGKVRTSVAY